MAIRPEDEYGTRAVPASPEYPHGSAKDETADGANDGTPYTRAFRDDLWGFFQWLLVQGGVTPSGDPDTVLASDYGTALRAITISNVVPDWGFSSSVGTLAAVGDLQSTMGLCALNRTDVLGQLGNVEDSIQAYRYDGSTFATLGNPFALGDNGDVTALSGTRIAAALVGGTLAAYDFDGTNWSLVGAALSITAGGRAICSLNATDVLIASSAGGGQLQAYRFDGSTWATLGNALAIPGGMTNPGVTALSADTVAVVDSESGGDDSDFIATYTFDGTNWSLVGAALNPTPSFSTPDVVALNGSDVMVHDRTGLLRIFRFDGSAWSAASPGTDIGATETSAITVMGGGIVALLNGLTDSLEAYRTDFTIGAPYSPAGGAF